MTINIKGHDLDLIVKNRLYLIYENKFGESVDFNTKKYSTLMANLLYATILATIEKQGLNITFTDEEFKDFYDEQSPTFFKDFSDWFILQIQAQAELSEDKGDAPAEKNEKN